MESSNSKSTNLYRENRWFVTCVSADTRFDSRCTVNTLCDRDDSMFMLVDAMCRLLFPRYSSPIEHE